MDSAAFLIASLGLIFTLIGVAFYLGRVIGDLSRQVHTLGRNYGDLLLMVGSLSDRMKDVELEVMKLSRKNGG